MTAIVQPTVVGSGGTVADARNVRGSVTGVAPGATQTIVSVVVGSRKLRGLIGRGTGDAEFWVEIDSGSGFTRLAGMADEINAAKEIAYVVLPNPEVYVASTATARLRVRNQSSVASDFEGILLGE